MGAGGVGVQGVSDNGLGGTFHGGVAAVRLIPGDQSARTLGASGHQAGALHVTSDYLLFFYDGTDWREVLLAAAARSSSANTTTQPVQPAPPPRH